MAFTLLLGAWSLLLLAWLTLQWGIVPRIGQWKPEIEQKASDLLGVPVSIGALRVRSSGWMPLFELDDVVLSRRPDAGSGAAAAQALRLPRVHAALSARSLLGLQVRFEQLHVEGADLEVRRDAQGRLFVAGIEVRAGGPDDDEQGAGTDWLLAQRELVVRHGRLRWVDERSGAAPVELTDVDLVVRNGLARHDIRLDATPPAQAGARFTLMGRFTQPLLSQRSNWRRWHGTVYAELPQADAAAVAAWLPPLPVQARAGTGSLRAWVDIKDGRPQGVTADLALLDVALHFPGPDKLLALDRLQGRVGARRDGRTLRFSADGLTFAASDIDWPATRLALALREAEVPAPAAAGASAPPWVFDGGEFSADRLDLAALARLAAQLPLGAAIDTLLADLLPSGLVRDLSARWDGALGAPARYQLKARAQGLTVAPAVPVEGHRLGRPGWRNANLDLDASETGGTARLSIERGSIIVPGVFEQAEVALDSFSTRLAWRIAPQAAGLPSAVEVSLSDTEFANADAQGKVSVASWRTGPGTGSGRGGRFPGQLDLAGQLTRGDAAAVARYLPLGVSEAARRYIERAVVSGKVASATFRVKGDLGEFPFVAQPAPAGSRTAVAPPPGEFRIVGRVQDVQLAYVPAQGDAPSAWPAFSGVSADLVFDRTSMEIRNAQARLWGLELTKVGGTIRDLAHPTLAIDGQVRGPLADLVRYVNASPVAGWTGQALRDANAGGNADLRLALELPLAEIERSTVQGTLTLAGNDLRIAAVMPLLAGTRARVGFTHKGLTVTGGSARVLGGEATFEGGTQPDGSLRFAGQGVATAEGLRRAVEFGSVSRLAASASGQASYRLTLGIAKGRTEFALTSPLTGLGLELPAPLRKPAEVAWPLRVETRAVPDAPTRDTVRVELGNVLTAQYLRDHPPDAPTQVLRGAIGVQEPLPPLPERGVHAVFALDAVDADAWQAAIDRVPAGGAPAAAAGDGYLPRTVALRAQSLVSGGRRLTNLVVGVSQDAQDGTWRGSLDADQLGGYVEYRAGRTPAQPGRVYARLARLALPPSDASSVESLLAEAPATVPALDIVIDNFELRGKKLGRVEVEAVNRGTREWRMTRFAVTTPEAQLTGTGQWQAGGATAQRMVMDFRLDLADSGAFLDRLGFPGTLRGGKGRMSGQVSWAGSPLAFHVPSLDGRLSLALDSGQFLKAGPGAGRLLSVLSLQSLPRRLALDFRDLFQEGFAFDNITGEVTVDDGVAATRNLRMRGVQAVVLMEGSADLQRETQDLRVVVVPEINAGTASLAYAAINPAVGLGTFLAQMFLRRPLMAASTREFTVQGSWVDPKVERVERKLGEPMPDLDAPAAPASAPPGNS